MKMIIITDPELMGECGTELSVMQLREWHRIKEERFVEAIGRAGQEGAGYAAVFGRLIGEEFAPEEQTHRVLDAVKSAGLKRCFFFLDGGEALRFGTHPARPEELTVLTENGGETYLDENIFIHCRPEGSFMRFSGSRQICIKRDGRAYAMSGLGERQELPEMTEGLLEISWDEDGKVSAAVNEERLFRHEKRLVTAGPEDSCDSITQKLIGCEEGLDRRCFLSVVLSGTVSAGVCADPKEIKKRLEEKVFCADFTDMTALAPAGTGAGEELTLRDSFINEVFSDRSLDEGFRRRIAHIGLSAVEDKGVKEE
ncbi:MAG: hypothetical protein IJ806_04340 [Ruminococcus sp.]|nr:hypothetical protein [Ruminococcus sp.]